jgi:protein-S-isoprenylcysteine O-methyltransferase Ste14
MAFLDDLSIAVFVAWCVSELVIGLISLRHRSRNLSEEVDRFSHFIVWVSTVPPIGLAYLIRIHLILGDGFGSLSPLFPGLGYAGCLMMAVGMTIRQLAVATLRRQFTLRVAIVENHELVETGVYRLIRHPAYLGHLASLLGIGMVLGNWVSLTALVVLPLAGVWYRIQVEESVLLRHFGPAYRAYARRTKRLLPGIW